jgi:isoleucyl-tRNA synthetase
MEEQKQNDPERNNGSQSEPVSDGARKSKVALREEKILKFWREHQTFQKALEKDAPRGNYVFYDGPPFATGTPHYGHILASAIKDAIPRYQTMRGFRVPRRWGWDCHGLPIENIVEKDLGISGKKQIEEMGVEKFNEYARSKVLTYVSDWKKTIERMARWVDFDGSYKTMDNTYIESVWWALSELNRRKLIYEGVRVLPYCPRCETPIANSEIAMDNSYKDITDISVYVKLQLLSEENTSLIAWTTTPWTLPGNTAAAVNPELTYIKVEHDGTAGREFAIIAKDRFETLKDKFKNPVIILELSGASLVGKRYEPIFPYFANTDISNVENGWRVYPASYVTTDTGTGIVHLAPAYGEEDMDLALVHHIPFVRHVGHDGKFTKDVTDFAGKPAKPKGEEKDGHQVSDIEIIKYLAPRGTLFAKEKIVHSYPHCFRCETPLYYFAIPAWFIRVSEIKEELLAKNEEMNWVPEHLKLGRFAKSMEGAPDWNISRNRYWASPLPIWKAKNGKTIFVSSLDELKGQTKKSGNTFFTIRHGQASNNTATVFTKENFLSASLTEEGKKQVAESIKNFDQKVDYVISSPFSRTKETAAIICTELGYPLENVIYDDRLKEWDISSEYEGKPQPEFKQYYDIDYAYSPKRDLPDGENFADLVKRVGEFVYEIDAKYAGKNILFVTHAGVCRAFDFVANGKRLSDLEKNGPLHLPQNAEITSIPFVPLPHNGNFELDFHRPYIDAITLVDEEGVEYMRIPEVIDCWFESGSMPFAQDHFPFERPNWKNENFPAGFVAEYIAQTRTWFYYTHLLSTVLFNHAPFQNVVTTGTVLAEDGQKMSKSKQNFPDPWIIFDKYGVDALRLYLLSNPIMRGEDLNFSEREVADIYRKIIMRFDNVREFYELYRDQKLEAESSNLEVSHVLDSWILARLRQVVALVTEGMEKYELDEALRPLALFVDDLSTWYLRRSRDRIKDGDMDAKKTLYFVLKIFAKLLAPFAPFAAEETYRALRTETDPESVHLTSWPEVSSPDDLLKSHVLSETMSRVREVVTLGLEARQKANIKVRQPLRELRVKSHEIAAEYQPLIMDELNVKEVLHDKTIAEEVLLDTLITPELREEGMLRDFIRAVQEVRKTTGLHPADRIDLALVTSDEGKAFITKFEEIIVKDVGATTISFTEVSGEPVKIDTLSFTIGARKVV